MNLTQQPAHEQEENRVQFTGFRFDGEPQTCTYQKYEIPNCQHHDVGHEQELFRKHCLSQNAKILVCNCHTVLCSVRLVVE